MNYRLLVARKRCGYYQMAVDEAILDAVAGKRSPETVRFFDFEPMAVTVGRLQHVDGSLLEACRANGIDIVRRLTGGRMVVHAQDFTFSLIVHSSNPTFGGTVYRTYRSVSAPFLSALRSIGIPVEWRKPPPPGEQGREGRSGLCFDATSRYEIVVQGRKILGISQYRRADTVLVQGTLLLKKPEAVYRKLFGDDVSTAAFSSVSDTHQAPVDFAMVADLLRDSISSTYGVNFVAGELSALESRQTDALEEKYRSTHWRRE